MDKNFFKGAAIGIGLTALGVCFCNEWKKTKPSVEEELKNYVLKYRTDPNLRKEVYRLTRGLQNGIDKIRSIYYYMQENFDYLNDPAGYDHVFSPLHLKRVGAGDCDCLSAHLATLLVIAGYHARFVRVLGYVFVEVFMPAYMTLALPHDVLRRVDNKLKGIWIPLEATAKDCDIGYLPTKFRRDVAFGRYFTVDPL